MVKQALQLASRTGFASRFVSLLERCDRGRDNLLQVLTYHRVDEPHGRPDLSPSTLSATPASFARQMAHLAKHYRVVSMNDVLAAWRGEMRLPPRAVLLTFDDAYQDFQEHAWPILKRHQFPATLFVPTSYPDDPRRQFWWDRLFAAIQAAPASATCCGPWEQLDLGDLEARQSAYAKLVVWLKSQPHAEAMDWVERITQQLPAPPTASPVLSWDALRQLAREGVTLGAHTRTHPLLSRISYAEALAEAAGSLADLRREIGDALPVFAYPGGKFNPPAVQAVREAGFELAFGGRPRGSNSLDTADPLRLRRNNISLTTNDAVFRARLLSWPRFLNPLRPVTGK